MTSIYMIGSHIVGAGGSVISSGSASGTFVPVGSQSMTGTIVDQGSVTLNGTGFGTKTNASQPVIWAPGNAANPSSLGRVTTWSAPSGGLVATAGGGPSGVGYYSGSANAGPGGTGTQTGWTLGFDVDSDPGWSGYQYAINSYGQKMCVSTKQLRHAMGFLLGDGSSPGQYNTKNMRCWARSGAIGSSEAVPDFYSPPCNGRFVVENITVDWSPSPDYNADLLARTSGEVTQDTWVTNENLIQSNSNSSTADANYIWQVLGPQASFAISNITNASSCVVTSSSSQSTNPFENSGNNEQQLIFYGVGGMTQINSLSGRVTAAGGSSGAWTATVAINTSGFGTYTSGGNCSYLVWNFPNVSYQTNSWKFLNASISGLTNAVAGGGNILRIYPCHYVVDGTSGRNNAPLGGYISYADVFVDDSWYGVWIQDSPIWNAAGVREPQIVASSGWSNTSINIGLLRRGMMASGSNGYVFTTDVNRNPTLQGHVIWP